MDRHVKNGNGDFTAVIWDSPVTGKKEIYSYKQLLDEVEVLAGVLREEGVKKGDVVLLYSKYILTSDNGTESSSYTVPMIPAAFFAILAISRLGAIHTVVFGGFAPASLAQRIEASKPKIVMTASCGIEGAKGPVDYKPFVEGALENSSFKPEKTIVWQREQVRWSPMDRNKGERRWQGLIDSARRRGIKADPVPVQSSDGLYIIYTSGKCATKISCIYISNDYVHVGFALWTCGSCFLVWVVGGFASSYLLTVDTPGKVAKSMKIQAPQVFPRASCEKPAATP